MLDIAVIGAGGWGAQHTTRLLTNPRIRIKAFVDANPMVLENLQKQFNVRKEICFTNVEQATQTIDFNAAVVSVPNPDRIPLIIKLIKRNIHILMEKPAAHSVKDLKRLLKTAQKSKSLVMVSQNYRFLKAAQTIRKIITSAQLGSLRHINLYFSRRESFVLHGFYARLKGPLLIALELGTHHIDLLNYFTGSFPLEIRGKTWHEKRDDFQADAHLAAFLEYPQNVAVTYHSTLMGGANRTNWPGRFEIACEKGHIVWDEAWEENLRILQSKKNGSVREKIIPNIPPCPEQSLDRIHDAFIKAVKGPIPTEARGCLLENNTRCVLTGLAIHESGRIERPVDFKKFYKKELGAYADL